MAASLSSDREHTPNMNDEARAHAPAVQRSDLVLAAVVCVLSLAILLMYRPWAQPATGDLAFYQLIGRFIADGQVPYRDALDLKTPFASYANASVGLLSDWFGFDYVLGARGLSVTVFALGGGLTYLLARVARFDRMPAMVAALLFLAADGFAWAGAGGFEPKGLMSVIGIAGLIAAYRRLWIVSGMLCALAFLTWQPAGAFLLGAGTTVLLIEPRQRVRAVAMLVAGFAAPVAIFLLYLLIVGAVDDFWSLTVNFNQERVGSPPWPPAFDQMADNLNRGAKSDRWLFLVGAIGVGVWMAAIALAALRRRGVSELLPQAPLCVMALGTLAYSCINFTGWGDFLPFVPWMALWSAWLVHGMRKLGPPAAVASALSAVVLVGYGHHTLIDQTELQSPSQTFSWQRDQVREIEESVPLADDDRVYIMHMYWFLLLSDHENAMDYCYANGGCRYVADREGSYSPITAPIEQGEPKLVVLGFPAESHIRAVTIENYRKIEPTSLPSYFSGRAEYWIRSDLAAGATADLLASEAELEESCAQAVNWQDAAANSGKLTSVVGPVVGVQVTRFGSVKIDVGAPNKFAIVLSPIARQALSVPAEEVFAGETVCVRGVVRPTLGVPVVTVDDPSSVLVVSPSANTGRLDD